MTAVHCPSTPAIVCGAKRKKESSVAEDGGVGDRVEKRGELLISGVWECILCGGSRLSERPII